MSRVMSAVLLLVGAALLVTWLVSPADSAQPSPTPVARGVLEEAALVADINVEVDRLHNRPSTLPSRRVPTRDLFNYGSRAAAAHSVPKTPAEPVAPVDLVPAPVLVAILAGSGAARRAVFAATDSDGVQFLASGDTIGRFVVGEIQENAVTLTDRRTEEVLRLTLR